MSTLQALIQKIEDRSAVVGVVGLGYVGLPLAHTLHEGGLRVRGYDIDEDKIIALGGGRSFLKHVPAHVFKTLATSDRFSATTDFGQMHDLDAILVCVPTPLGPHQEPDLSFVRHSAQLCGHALREGQLIVLESTTYPGTTRDVFQCAIESTTKSADLVEGRDYFVAYSPEREDPGRESHSTRTIPKLVGGLSPTSTQAAAALYRVGIDNVVEVSSAEVAEGAKILENVFRAVNIAMINEMKVIFDAMDVDVWEVVRAAATKPFGFMPFYPGPGLGGHCIPIDPFYLTWRAREVGHPTRFIELAGEINTYMPRYVVDRTVRALNEQQKPVNGSKILVLGLAYKPDVDDTRESPSFELIELLTALGGEVDYSDPFIPRTKAVRRHDLRLESQELTPENLESYDVILISTNHDAFDYELISRHARLVIDTRDSMRAYAETMGARLVRA